MDRASDSGSEGWGFESLPVYQKYQAPLWVPDIFIPGGTRTHLHATPRWGVAVTSVCTGHNIYLIPSPRRDKMHIESLLVYQSNIIRTISSKSEAGSDYLFIFHNGNKGCCLDCTSLCCPHKLVQSNGNNPILLTAEPLVLGGCSQGQGVAYRYQIDTD